MKNISIIKVNIESISPLFISNGEDVLLDEERQMSYIPATTITGAFRSYLEFAGEDVDILFGTGEDNSKKSSIYIRDSFAKYRGFERRDGVKINSRTGASVPSSKMEGLYLKKGLNFSLDFKIQGDKVDIEIKKSLLFKAIKALDDSYIRLGGNKTNGFGVFKVKTIKQVDFDFKDLNQWIKYSNKDYKEFVDITEKILTKKKDENFVEFVLTGSLTTPLLIASGESLDLMDVDNKSIKSDGDYIIPGSSFKGVIRSRIEEIANLFDNLPLAQEVFGDMDEKNKMSRVYVKESIIDNTNMDEKEYNRINIDKFTGGVRKTGLMNEIPIQGNVEFKLIYKLLGEEEIDCYALGIIILALRDLARENLSLGSGFSIGRGRYSGENLFIISGDEKIEINFKEKTILNEDKLNTYIKAVKNFKPEERECGE